MDKTLNLGIFRAGNPDLTGEGAADVDQLPHRVARRRRPLRGPLRHALGNLLAGEQIF